MTLQPKSHCIIAIDGPAGAGKSTIAKRLARALKFTLLDTGAIYRALAWKAREQGVSWQDGPGLVLLGNNVEINFEQDEDLNRVILSGQDISDYIRTPEISRGASMISALPEVRNALLEIQRGFAQRGPVVAEGRDTGTVVFPQAQFKLFLMADPQIRAQRRYQELIQSGHTITEAQVLEEQQARDMADEQRLVAPLRPANDAIVIDTSQLNIEEVLHQILTMVTKEITPCLH